MADYYTRKRIKFLLGRYWQLEEGHLPRYDEELSSGQWLGKALQRGGYVNYAWWEDVAVIKADLDMAFARLEPKYQVVIKQLLINRTKESAPNVGIVARQLNLSPSEVYQRINEGAKMMASILNKGFYGNE